MVKKTIWATLTIFTLGISGCATLTAVEPPLSSQRLNNQPQHSEIDAPVNASATGSAPSAKQNTASIPITEPDNESASTTLVIKPRQDPGAEVIETVKPTAPPPSPEQVVIRLQQQALQLQSEGQWQAAETVLQRALRIDVQKVDIYHQLATVRMGQQRFSEAEQIAMKGLTYTDKSPSFKASLWEVIAQCRSAQGDINGANAAREEMLKWLSP